MSSNATLSRNRRSQGFTITEVMVAAVISTLLIGSVTAALVQSLRAWRAAGIRSELHMDLERSMERMRHDLRLSSVGIGLMAFYPADAVEYTAISFPLATPDADGLLPRDSAGNIIWDTTIIYHVRPGSPDELIRSTFTPRNPNATPADLYEQLVKVVQSTSLSDVQSAVMQGERATSQVIFRNLVNMTFRPPEMRFDGYAPQYERARRFTWGSVVLSNGVNQLTFTVQGKNAQSQGYKVGIDRYALSYSASPREPEWVLPEHSRPSFPYFRATTSGGSMVAQDMSMHGASWSGLSQLTYTPNYATAGEAGSQLTFYVQNDIWNDATFDNPPGEIALNCRRRADMTFTNQAPYIPDIVIAVEEGLSWEVANIATTSTNRSLSSSEVINVLAPEGILLNGSYARFQVSSGITDKLQVRNVHISGPIDVETLGANIVSTDYSWTPIMFPGGNSQMTIDNNSTLWTDWSPVPVPIDREAGYLVRWNPNPGSADPVTDARVFTGGNLLSYSGGTAAGEMIALTAMEVRAPANAVYRSAVFDTRVDSPVFSRLAWTQVTHGSNGMIGLRVRSSSFPDMRDAIWYPSGFYLSDNNNSNISAINGGRYIQYEALFTVAGDHTQLPILRDVTMAWQAPTGIVDLVVDLARGPDYGIIKAEVNGQSFIRGVEIELEIFREGPFGMERAPGTMEVRPLNTGR